MKLAYVSNFFPFAPEEQFFEAEVESLCERFEVVLVPSRATSAHNYYPGLRAETHYMGMFDRSVRRLAWQEFWRRPAAAAAAFASVAFGRSALRARIVNLILFPKALALASEARRLGFEHMHVNWITSPATVVYVASRLTGIPFSITAHQHDIFFDNLLIPKAGAAQFVRVISQRNLEQLQSRLPHDLAVKCKLVHLGVRVPPKPAPRETIGPARILCPARLCQWKGHRYLLAALADMRARGIAFTCDFAGGGELRRRVARDIARRKLGDRVRLLGNVPHRELTASLERGDYDLAVLASTERGNEHEGIPVALMEAMAAGLPVVATRTGSIPELVDAASGLLVEQRDPAALAAALEALTEHPERRARMGDFGRGRIIAAFSTVKTTRALEDLLLASAPWFGQEGTQRRGP